ncbi:MAG: transcriptional regulator NrdR, partial [Dehalococcoidales bacterium]|nr:transcriptional regulator NrdR [Dehalococcoidales bacterium]
MNCPYCSYHDSRVIDSRDVNDGTRRRRQCLSCGSRFTTYERLQSANLYVIKKDGRREEFNRVKLLSGIRKACEKRPLPTGTVDKLVDDIEAELYNLGKTEVPSTAIGDMVMDRLKGLDY